MSHSRTIAVVCSALEQLLATTLREPNAVFELAEEIADHPNGIQAVGLLLSLLERSDKLDWGTPGPVVHAVEKFFNGGYESLLLESVGRAPTSHTLWMVNRVINGIPHHEQGQFLSALRQAATRPDVSEEVRQTALDFLEFQQANA